MSQVLSAKKVCELALGAIGEFPVNESAADGEALRRAMEWLDLNMAEIAGTMRVFSLVPATIPIPLEAEESSYALNAALSADLPVDGVQFPIDAYIEDADGNRYPVEIVTLDRFSSIWRADCFGRPTQVHISRLPTPVMRVFPVIAATDPASWTLNLDVQSYAPNVAPAGVTGNQPSASILHSFRVAWQRHLVLRLACDLGSGPIRKLPEMSLKRFETQAKEARAALEAFENREHETSDPICEPWGM